jgi:hypothetical protein
MQLLTRIPREFFADTSPEGKKIVAYIAREQARVTAKINEVWIQKRIDAGLAVPRLYESAVMYRPEPLRSPVEEFATIPEVLERGWGDCDDLAPYRVAEIRRLERRPADIVVYFRPETKTWHLQLRHWTSRAAQRAREIGIVEDPSRLLGMVSLAKGLRT